MFLKMLVEGSDDLHVVGHLLRARGLLIEKEITDCKGLNRLLDEELPLMLGKLDYTAVGVVVDANANPAARWQSISDRLRSLGYDPPAAPAADGTIIRGEKTVGIWLMPNNSSTGTLEDFLEPLVPPSHHSLRDHARKSVAAIPADVRCFTHQDARKAELHTYLAWREEPGTPFGLAITSKYFDASATAADAFVHWFQRLRDAQ